MRTTFEVLSPFVVRHFRAVEAAEELKFLTTNPS
jgi:hypothetical protein